MKLQQKKNCSTFIATTKCFNKLIFMIVMNCEYEHVACRVDLSWAIKNMDSTTLCGTILSCMSVKACVFSESPYFNQQCMPITNKIECYFITVPHNVIKATQRPWMPLKRLEILFLIEFTMSSEKCSECMHFTQNYMTSCFWVVFYGDSDFSNISCWNMTNAYDLL